MWGSVVHILECVQPLFGFGFDVAVADEEHGDEAQGDEQRGVGEQHAVVDLPHQRAGHDRRDDLCGHGGRIVVAGELADVRALAHLDDHGQGVDVDGRPREADEREDDEHDGVDGREGRRQHVAQREADRQQHDAALDGP